MKQQKHVVILSTGHRLDDERFLYTLSPLFFDCGWSVTILGTYSQRYFISAQVVQEYLQVPSGARKIPLITEALKKFKPDIILCAEVSALFAAATYKNKFAPGCFIINDITEFFPLNVTRKLRGFRRIYKTVSLTVLKWIASFIPDCLFYTEAGKITFWDKLLVKNRYFLPFFPLKALLRTGKSIRDKKTISILYSADCSEERGLPFFISCMAGLADELPEKQLRITLLGEIDSEHFQTLIKPISVKHNIELIHFERLSYSGYLSTLSEQDIAFDLRMPSAFFNRSLPIKIFDFLAAGLPFIASNLKSLADFRELINCGIFVEYGDTVAVIQATKKLIAQPELYASFSDYAMMTVNKKYNRAEATLQITEFLKKIQP